jgi:hypothetical protein
MILIDKNIKCMILNIVYEIYSMLVLVILI